ncbi:MAG: SIMPL domain-containing protein, partial [Aldersonia sp.]|nr:SIMPL domain-containing protein [Aldersonia sp.]
MRRSFSARTAKIAVLAAAMIGAATVACSNAESDGGSARQVTVVGSGEVRGAPDVLNADIGVEFTATDVSGAISGANERARAMMDAVTADGVAREDIRTTGLSLQPEYATPGIEGGSRTVSGYLATNTVRVVVRDLGKAS